jgi:hypothetical protein
MTNGECEALTEDACNGIAGTGMELRFNANVANAKHSSTLSLHLSASSFHERI